MVSSQSYLICSIIFGNLVINNAFQQTSQLSRFRSLCRSTKLNESALPFAGSGPRQVDMNQYNVELDVIEEQWTANIIAKTIDTDGGILLGVKNAREYFVDNVSVTIPRPSDGGLGIALQEIAGGRDDGLGITVVSGLVENGYVESCDVDILPCDSISSLSIVRN